MILQFFGVRGSTPAPGPAFVRTGGHTSCVGVTLTGAAGPRLVLDGGTGLRALAASLLGAPFRGTILLTHLHWDHWQGLPFFGAGDRHDAEVRVVMPAGDDAPVDILRRAMSPPHFPIGPEGLKGRWHFDGMDEGTFEVEGAQVSAFAVPHKGGRTFGYRIDDGHGSLAYVPDHRPHDDSRVRASAVAACRGVDVLIHDAQFVSGEEERAREFGHATVDQAIAFAAEADVGELVLFHHDPSRSDDALDQIVADVRRRSPVVSIAREGARMVV